MHADPMVVTPFLRWWFTALFVLPGLFFLVRCLVRRVTAVRISDGLHVLMCAGMIVMMWPAAGAVPVAAQLAVFGLGTLWFAGLVVVGYDDCEWPRSWGAHAHHAIMMAGMVWMVAIMSMQDHVVPGLQAGIAAVLAVLLLFGAGAVAVRASRAASGVPLPVAADVLMSVGMAGTTLVLIT
ncbi:DUF5134 domain-containing protein [Actinosynnema sp. ALI-1.44]|uniref:DUF5134 domain-containing protein n=1 Tax=Actinosynnema sp. ALI-1.44 TaxID=1933779 RepID=UPI001178A7EB|nr:DUF5134 domain-containing protein [Actinosynnema sp. ALI-1.44]